MKKKLSSKKNKLRVLFFGVKNCRLSQKAFEQLKNLGFDVTVAWSESRSQPLIGDLNDWMGEYILCFRSYFILSKELIESAKIAAINFHPAPPEYPGSGGMSWALYDGKKEFGVTAHFMDEYVDHGRIIECRKFIVYESDDINSLSIRTMQKSYEMFIDYAKGLARRGSQYLNDISKYEQNEEWKGKPRKISEIDKLQSIEKDCTKSELEKIIKATNTELYPPYIMLHGYKFTFVNPKDEGSNA